MIAFYCAYLIDLVGSALVKSLMQTVKLMFAAPQPKVVSEPVITPQVQGWFDYLETPGELYNLLDGCRDMIKSEGGILHTRYAAVVALIKVVEPMAMLSGLWKDPQDFFRSRMEALISAMLQSSDHEPYSKFQPLAQAVQQWKKYSEYERSEMIRALDQVAKHKKIREMFVFQRDFNVLGAKTVLASKPKW